MKDLDGCKGYLDGIFGNPSLTKIPIKKFAGRSGSEPIGVLDRKYWSFGCLVDPPSYPPVGTWGPKV